MTRGRENRRARRAKLVEKVAELEGLLSGETVDFYNHANALAERVALLEKAIEAVVFCAQAGGHNICIWNRSEPMHSDNCPGCAAWAAIQKTGISYSDMRPYRGGRW